MNARSFFDTNVLVYADDDDAPAKQRVARDLWHEHRRGGTGVVSLQVLQEYFVTVTGKLKHDPRKARRKVELLAEFDVAEPDVSDILAAIDLHRHQPGVEAGKKAASKIIQFQCQVLEFLSKHSGKAFTAKEIANGIGAGEESEHVYKICEHLSANQELKTSKSFDNSILNNKYVLG